MTIINHLPAFEIIYVIVNYGMGSKVMHRAREYGIKGGTIFLAKGTISNPFLNFLSLYDERKEIVLLAADKKTADYTVEQLSKVYHFEKPHHGIAFTISASSIFGLRCSREEENEEERGVEGPMYQVIITIVNRGKAEDVISAANEAGAKGGTIMNARGAGADVVTKLFNMEIEPEKEMVMVLAKVQVTDHIVTSIREKLEIDKPGNGIIFIQDINNVYGIYE